MSVAASAARAAQVLLSHADAAHIAALPYAAARLGLTAPVFATLPCAALGHLVLYELLASKQARAPLNDTVHASLCGEGSG